MRKINLLIIPLVFAILVIIGLIVAIVQMDADVQKAINDAAKFKAQRERAMDERVQMHQQYQKLVTVISKSTSVQFDAILQNYLRSHGNKLLTEYITQTLGDPSARNLEFSDFVSIYEQLFQERAILLARARELEVNVRAERIAKEKAIQDVAKTRTDKDAQIEEKSAKIQQLEEEKANQAAVFENEKVQLKQQIKEVVEELERQTKSYEMQIAYKESIITDLKHRIRELTKKDEQYMETDDPDGEIIYAEEKLGKAWVNLGRIHGVRKGLSFNVFQVIKGGKRKPKGKVEIIKIDDYQSEVVITQVENEKDPIIRGDKIISPFYDKEETQIFVFCGDLVNPKYSKRELEKKIEEIGGKVAPTVTVESDYLVVGKNAIDLPDYEKALLYGVRMIREDELLDYLGR